MFFDIRLRTEKPLFFAAPQRHANRSARFYARRFQQSRRFHHNRAADGIIGCARRRVPRIEMSAEHYYFVFFVRSRNFTNNIIRSRAFGNRSIANVELQRNRRSVSHKARNSSVIFITQNNRRHGFWNVERAIVKSANLSVFTSGIVDANHCAAVN